MKSVARLVTIETPRRPKLHSTMRRVLSIFCDGSHKPRVDECGYGVVTSPNINCDKAYSIPTNYPKSAMMAEALALVESAKLGVSQLGNFERVVIYSDCLGAIRLWSHFPKGRHIKGKIEFIQITFALLELKNQSQGRIVIMHVPAHNRCNDKFLREFNTLADTAANIGAILSPGSELSLVTNSKHTDISCMSLITETSPYDNDFPCLSLTTDHKMIF